MSTKNFILLFIVGALLAGFTHASAQYSPGNLVVSTYGSTTGTPYLDGQATPITLLEYALPNPTSASLVMSHQLPTTGTGGNVGIVGEYGSSSEGTLQVSGDGKYLTIGGYDGNLSENGAPAGGYGGSNTAEAQSTSANVPRVEAVINLSSGSVNTSTVLNNIYSTNNPRSVYSPNGTSLLISGQGPGASDEGGIYATTVGTNTTAGGATPTKIFNAVSTRTVTQANINPNGTISSTPNTYYSADQNSNSKGTQTGIFEYAGTPSSSQGSNPGTRITPVTAVVNGVTANLSPQGFAFANATTLYVADTGDPKAGGTGDGGIQKWSYSSSLGTWNLDYTLTASTFVPPSQATAKNETGETGFEALALTLNGGNVDIYAVSYTASDADPNGLYAIVDPLSATSLSGGASTTTSETTELAAAPGLSNKGGADFNFKGVALAPAAAPEPSENAMMLLALLGGLAYAWKRKKSANA